MDLFGQNSAGPKEPFSAKSVIRPQTGHQARSRGELGTPFGSSQSARQQDQPLASRMRPKNLQDFAGQQHLLGPNGFLYQAIEQERHGRSSLGNIVLWGPPGSGKTTLALLLSELTGRPPKV